MKMAQWYLTMNFPFSLVFNTLLTLCLSESCLCEIGSEIGNGSAKLIQPKVSLSPMMQAFPLLEIKGVL